jgi:hypothetical protein
VEAGIVKIPEKEWKMRKRLKERSSEQLFNDWEVKECKISQKIAVE